MPELNSWPTQNTGPTGTVDSRETATHVGALVYPHTSALKSKSGFRPGPGASPGLVTATGTPDANVHVAPFQLLLQNIRGSGLGTYIAALDAIKDINILSTPANPTNPRDDLIIAQQSDIFDADANSDFLVRHVVGTPAAVPADPAVTGSTNYITLARVRVNALATTITSGNITDLRTTGHAKSLVGGLYAVALGGILPVASQAQRDALTGTYNGLAVWREDLKYIDVTDGSAWRPQGLVKIAEQSLSGTAASVTFSSIPATFRALRIVTQARGDFAATSIAWGLRFNADSSAVYNFQQLLVSGTSVTASQAQSETRGYLGEISASTAPAGAPANHEITIANYAGTTLWKQATTTMTMTTGTGAGGMHSRQLGTLWRNTAAITSITLLPDSGNFISGSNFTLYGMP